MDENLWDLVSGSFEKFASDCAITYYDSENPGDCLSLTFLQLFQDSEIIYKELQASKKKSPVALRFPDDSASMVAAYAAIIAAIRSVLRPHFCQVEDLKKFQLYFFIQFLVIKTLDPEPDSLNKSTGRK